MFKKIFKKKVKGAGGLLFIFVAMASVSTLLMIVSLSRSSTAMSISDNVAHIISTNVSVISYQTGQDTYVISGGDGIKRSDGTMYYPLEDFNKVATSYGYTKAGADNILVKWDNAKKQATVQVGQVKTTWNEKIRPHEQQTVIESN